MRKKVLRILTALWLLLALTACSLDIPTKSANEETKKELLDYCSKHIAKYAMPYDIEFRDELPKTLVGKVAYRKLEEEEEAKTAAAAAEN